MSEEGVERKLTTILAAEVVGYSRIMEADEVATAAIPNLESIRADGTVGGDVDKALERITGN